MPRGSDLGSAESLSGYHASREEMPRCCDRKSLMEYTQHQRRLSTRHINTLSVPWGSHVARDSWVSVMYPEGLNSAKSSGTLQRTDRHGILDQKRSDFQESV
jgi:hypothetical protein